MQEKKELYKIVEAVLFSFGEPVSFSQLKTALDCDDKGVIRAIEELQKYYEDNDSPLGVKKLEDEYQIYVKKAYYDELIKVVKRPKRVHLSESILETLSIIAYKQPVIKSDIENIRGVSCDYAVNKLLELGLICESGRLDAIGRPMLFSTTDEFLRRFDFSSKDEVLSIYEKEPENVDGDNEAYVQLGFEDQI